MKEDIESIIQEDKLEEDVDTDKLRQSLSKFQSENYYLNKIEDDGSPNIHAQGGDQPAASESVQE